MKAETVERKRAALYARVSRAEEGKGSQSISNQLEIARNYAINRGLYVVYEFIDEGVSGGAFDRNGLNRLLEKAVCGEIDVVVVKDLSRLGRSMRKVGELIDLTLLSLGVGVVSVDDGCDCREGDSLSVAIKNLFNEYYLRDFKRKCKCVRDYIAKNKHMNYYPKYGYSFDQNGLEIIDGYSAKIVKWIFQSAINGLNCNEIAERLNANGVFTRSKYVSEVLGYKRLRRSNSEKWTVQGVWSVLSDCEYAGNSVNLVSKPKEQRITVKNTHLAIITDEEFKLANNTVRRKPRKTDCLSLSVYDHKEGKRLLVESNKKYPLLSAYFLRVEGKRRYFIRKTAIEEIAAAHAKMVLNSISDKKIKALSALKRAEDNDMSIDFIRQREEITEKLLIGKIDGEEYAKSLAAIEGKERELSAEKTSVVSAEKIVDVLKRALNGSGNSISKILIKEGERKKEFYVDVVYRRVRQMLSQTDIT